MKLSASINFFNGEELIGDCVANIRPNVDHLSIVFQLVSNYGNDMSARALEELENLDKQGLVDEFILFTPDFTQLASQNEYSKRSRGREIAIANQCTHFLSLDADEFYDSEEFQYAKEFIESYDIFSSTVRSYYYIKNSKYRSKELDLTNVSFISNISHSNFELNGHYPDESVDPTRRFYSDENHHYFFEPSEIVMHHMSGVRRDFSSKFTNTTTRQYGRQNDQLDRMKSDLENWEFPQELKLPSDNVLEFIELEKTKFNFGCLDPVNFVSERDERAVRPIALICQIWLNDYAGSEVVTIELAEEFYDRGYDVYLYTQAASGKILEEALSKGINVILPDTIDTLEQRVEEIKIVWMHHNSFPISWFMEQNRIEKLAASWTVFHMSPFEKLEYPVNIDFIKNNASTILFNSQETFEKLSQVYLDVDCEKKRLFPNPSPKSFKPLGVNTQPRDTLADVLVISNHPPPELLSAIDQLRESGINVTTVGQGQQLFQRVTPNLIRSYQVVVTIGKTVQYCLNTEISVYVYDHFGGPGFIGEENYQLCESRNFSGRGFGKKTSVEIFEELRSWIPAFQSQQIEISRRFLEKISLTAQINAVLKQAKYLPLDITNSDILSFLGVETRFRWLRELLATGELHTAIQELQHQNGSLQGTIQELQHQNGSLQSANQSLLNQNQEINSAINSILSSNSWKITGPMRKIMGKFK